MQKATIWIVFTAVLFGIFFSVNTYLGFCNSFGESRAAKDYKDRYEDFCRSYDAVNDLTQSAVEKYAAPASLSFRISEDLKGDPKHPIPFEVDATPILLLRAGAWVLLFFGARKLIRKKALSSS